MATYQARIEDIAGTQADTAALSDWLTAGGRIVSDKFSPERLDLYATDKTDSGTGVDITGGRALSAHKSNYPARRISVNEKAAASDSNSNRYAIATDPKWYVDKTKGYVLPSGGTIRFFAYPTIAYDGETTANFPPQGIDPVIYYASIQAVNRSILDLLRTSLEGLSFTEPSAVTPPSAPSFTFTDASYSDAVYAEALIDTISSTTISAFSTAPSFNMPVFGGDFSTLTTPLDTNKDIELSNAHLARVREHLNQYASDIQNEMAKFNDANVEFQSDIQKKIEQARLDQQRLIEQSQLQVQLNMSNARESGNMDAINQAKKTEVDIINRTKDLEQQISEYSAKLQKYSGDIQDYASKVNEQVSKINTSISKYTNEFTGLVELNKSLKEEFNRLMETI